MLYDPPTVLVLRGVPGIGKSTLAARISAEMSGNIVSADDYFTNVQGEYNFKPEEIHLAHQACWRSFYALISSADHTGLVIVDNTNIHEAEIGPYVLPAEACGYKVAILNVVDPTHPSPADLALRTKHGVPETIIERMYMRVLSVSLPPWWKTLTVHGSVSMLELGVAIQELVRS